MLILMVAVLLLWAVVGSGDDYQYDHDHANKRGIVIHSITPFAVQTNTNAHLYRLVL